MYSPAEFVQRDAEKLWDFIQGHSFALLISVEQGVPVATHVPLLVRRSEHSAGELLGHIARANPQAASAAGQRVLAIFSGPHAYISPSWYEAERVVPTWNYVAVHATGRLETIHDPRVTRDILRATVTEYERSFAVPWSYPEDEYTERLLSGITAFRIHVERLEGKWKLSQNQPRERRERVQQQLALQPRPGAQAIAALMQQQLAEPPPEESEGVGT